MNKITLIGLDLAKSVFQVHGVDAEGNTVLKKRLTRTQMAEFFAQLEPCPVAMEACGSAHHWARKLAAFGHTPRLIRGMTSNRTLCRARHHVPLDFKPRPRHECLLFRLP